MSTNDSGMIMISNEEIDKYIQIIKTQTNYDDYYAIQKLKDFNYDYMKVIRDYMGIPEKKETKMKSVNQEIYKQIRYKMDTSMRDYTKRKEMSEKIKAYQEYVKQQMQQK